MATYRTAWHLLAATLIEERRPEAVTLETEVQLSKAPQQVDMLLLRKDDRPVDDAKAFHGLWRLMGPVALVEYKSRARPPRPGVLHQLLGYAHQYVRAKQPNEPAARLSLFLLAATVTPTIKRDVELLGYALGPPDGAYVSVIGTAFPTWVVPLNDVADEEGEPLIGELGSRTVDEGDSESLQWLARFIMKNEKNALHLESFDELATRFVKSPWFLERAKKHFQEGEAKGRAEGRVDGESAVLLRLLRRRFGDLPATVEQRVQNAKPELLVRWTDRILDAKTLEDVFDDD